MTKCEIGNRRLLNIARALRESEHPEYFSMAFFAYNGAFTKGEIVDAPRRWRYLRSTGDLSMPPCGTPACAMGHYGARRDLQRAFKISCNGLLVPTEKSGRRHRRENLASQAYEHFSIGPAEFQLLFSPMGCDNAKTTIAAARYIERFVEQRRGRAW